MTFIRKVGATTQVYRSRWSYFRLRWRAWRKYGAPLFRDMFKRSSRVMS